MLSKYNNLRYSGKEKKATFKELPRVAKILNLTLLCFSTSGSRN